MSFHHLYARYLARALPVAAVAVFVAGCGSASHPASTAGQAQSSTITLAFTGTLSGSSASYALDMKDGFNLAVSQINASGGIDHHKILTVFRDDQGEAQNGPVIAKEFCSNTSIRAVVGFSFSDVAVAGAPTYGQCQLPVIGAAVTSPLLSGISPYFFRTAATDASQGSQMAQYVVHVLHITRVAVLYQESDYGLGGEKAFTAEFQRLGGSVLYDQGYQVGAVDYTTPLAKVKAANPQALYIDGFYNEAAQIAKQAQQVGLKVRLLGTDGAVSPDLVTLGGSAVNGMTFYSLFSPTNPPTATARQFDKRYTATYHKEPSEWSALAYDAVGAISRAAKLGGGVSRAAIETGLTRVQFNGVTGAVRF